MNSTLFQSFNIPSYEDIKIHYLLEELDTKVNCLVPVRTAASLTVGYNHQKNKHKYPYSSEKRLLKNSVLYTQGVFYLITSFDNPYFDALEIAAFINNKVYFYDNFIERKGNIEYIPRPTIDIFALKDLLDYTFGENQ